MGYEVHATKNPPAGIVIKIEILYIYISTTSTISNGIKQLVKLNNSYRQVKSRVRYHNF